MNDPSWLQNLRAVAVLFHVLAVVVLSVPVPPPGIRGIKADARTEAQLAGWGSAAEAVGVPREVLFGAIRRFTIAEHAALTALRTPLRPYAKLVGAEQGWLMFGSVATDVSRLEILVETADGWSPLFVARSSEATWRRSLFDQERMRTLVYNFAARRAKAKWDPFATWIADKIGDERPDVSAVRVQMRRLRIPEPSVLATTGALEEREIYWVIEKGLDP